MGQISDQGMLGNTPKPNTNQISLQNDHQDGVLSLRQVQGPSYSDKHVEDLSQKYDVALGQGSPGLNSLRGMLSTSGQDRLASLAVTQHDLELEQARNGIIQSLSDNMGNNVTPELVQTVRNLGATELSSPDVGSVIEDRYAKMMVNLQSESTNANDGTYDKAITQSPDLTSQALDRAEWATSRSIIARNNLEDIQKQYDSQNLLMKGQAFLQTLIPFRSWYAQNSALDKDMPDYLKTLGGIVPGKSLRDQLTYMNTLPPAEYKRVLTGVMDRMKSQGDYNDAIQFAQFALQFGQTDENWQAIFAGLDVASVIPVGTLSKALKGASTAAALPIKEGEAITRSLDMMGESSHIAMSRSISKGILPSEDIVLPTDVERMLSGTARPSRYFTGVDAHAPAEVLGRMETAAVMRDNAARDIIGGLNKVNRLAPSETARAYELTQETMRKHFVNQEDHIVRFDNVPAENATNVNTVDMVLGKKNGDAFPSESNALAWAGRLLKLRTTDYKAVKEGTGWYIKVTRNVDEAHPDIIRNFTLETDSKQADTFWTRFKPLATVFGNDTKVGRAQQINRSTVVQSVERQNNILQEFAKPMSDLAIKDKNGYKELDSFLRTARTHVDPVHGRGITYNTQREFEDAFQTQFGKLPSEGQSDAYHAFKQYHDMDTIVRGLDVYRQKAALGIEKFTMARRSPETIDPTTKAVVDSKYIGDLSFEGKVIPELPRGAAFKAAVLDEDGILQKGNRFNGRAGQEKWDAIQEYIDKGYSIIQPYDGFVKLDDGYFDFVLVKNFQRDRPDLNMINAQNRMIQRYSHYVKQPIVTNNNGYMRYLFDRTIANGRDSVDAAEIAKSMNDIRLAEKNASGSGRALFESKFPMWAYEDFAKRITDKEIDLNVPFIATKAGSRTIDESRIVDMLSKEQKFGFFDKGDNFRLSNAVNGRFLNEDPTLFSTLASEQGTFFELATDSHFSPFEAMRISMNDLANVNILNDYKIGSARDYVTQFGNLLDANLGEFTTNPLKFILEPKYLRNADPGLVASAEATRKAILNMWNTTTAVDRIVNGYKETLIRSLRHHFGDNFAEWVDDKALPKIQNADRYLRGFAFHTKIGMFNPKQLFLQTSSAINIISISPRYGFKAAMLGSPMKAGLYARDDILRSLGSKFAKVTGMPADDYVEMIQMFKRSGFDLVGNDYAYMEDLKPPGWTTNKLIKGATRILDIGRTPFDMGERWARSMAFAAAYMERKAALAGKPFAREDEAWVLWRSKVLTGSMTKESASTIQKGWTGVATQFFGYQMRLMEQMLGLDGKLTMGERTRLFAGMSMVYGVPVATSMTIGVLPIRTMIKDWMNDHNVSDTGTVFEPFIDGFASTLLRAISGLDLNISERYGPNGINTFYDLLRGDATMTDLFSGASGGLLWDTLTTYDPIAKWVGASMQSGDMSSYQVTAQDWMSVLQQISSVNNAVKLYYGTNLGIWMTRNQNILTDVTPLEAYVSAAFGLDPERVTDTFSKLQTITNVHDRQNAAMKDMIADYRRGIQAMRSGDSNLAGIFFNRVKIVGHLNALTVKQFSQVYNRAINEEPLDEATLRNFGKIPGEMF